MNKAERQVEEECSKLIETEGFLNYGIAMHTLVGDPKCKYIIHAIALP